MKLVEKSNTVKVGDKQIKGTTKRHTDETTAIQKDKNRHLSSAQMQTKKERQ